MIIQCISPVPSSLRSQSNLQSWINLASQHSSEEGKIYSHVTNGETEVPEELSDVTWPWWPPTHWTSVCVVRGLKLTRSLVNVPNLIKQECSSEESYMSHSMWHYINIWLISLLNEIMTSGCPWSNLELCGLCVDWFLKLILIKYETVHAEEIKRIYKSPCNYCMHSLFKKRKKERKKELAFGTQEFWWRKKWK